MKELYLDFKRMVEDYNMINDKRIVILCSGGKDATIGLHFLLKYLEEKQLNLSFEPLLVTYPKHVYFNDDGSKTDEYVKYIEYWVKRGVNFNIFTPEDDDFEDGNLQGCSICKKARKKIIDGILNKYLENNENVTIVTGYTLYDIMAYIDEFMLLTNYTFNYEELNSNKHANRILNCLHKMNAKEIFDNGNEIVRPLIGLNEVDIKRYLIDNNIPYLSKPCKISALKHKRIYFNTLDILYNTNNVTYEGVLNLLKKNNVKMPENYEDISSDQFFIDC